jgi:hypothetical protein
MKSQTKKNLISIAISSILGFVGIALTMSLALFVSPIFSAILSSLPLTLVFFLFFFPLFFSHVFYVYVQIVWAVTATMSNSTYQQDTFDRSLVPVVIMYLVLTASAFLWSFLHLKIFEKDHPWRNSIWLAFACGISIWLLAVIVIIVLYFTNSKFHSLYSSPENEDDEI